MEIKVITRATLEAHEKAEQLLAVVSEAAEDKRFHLSLADHRKFRDLCEDMERMIDKAWVKSMEVPVDLPVNGQLQQVKIK